MSTRHITEYAVAGTLAAFAVAGPVRAQDTTITETGPNGQVTTTTETTRTTKTTKAPPSANGTRTTVRTPGGTTISVTVNDQSVPFAEDSGPVMLGGRVMVPLRGVVEKLGGSLHLEPSSKSITGAQPETQKQFRLKIGSVSAVANGQQMTLDTPPRVIHGVTYVPLRFISEAMGADVRWDNASHTVVIASAGRAARVSTGTAGSAVTAP